MRLKPLSKAVILATLTSSAAVTYAQGDSDSFMIEEIVVTAQKRAENAQNVAISMSVQTSESLENIGAFDFKDITKLSPGLEIAGDDAVSGSIKMRGVGKDAFTGSMDDAVVVFIDGVAQSSVGAAFGSLSDIERVEVLRGPQGTLYGKNAPAGAINVTTKSVNMEEFEGGFQTSHTYYDDTQTYGMNNKFNVNLPLIEGKLGMRLSGFLDDSEGYVENGLLDKAANDFSRSGGRIKLQYTPTETLDITVIGNYSDHYTGSVFQYTPGYGPDYISKREASAQGTPSTASNTFADVFGGNIPVSDKDSYEMYSDVNAYSRTRLRDGQVNLNWDVGGHTLTSITYYQDVETEFVNDQRGTPIRDALLEIDIKQSIFTQELRLANNDIDKLEYMLGFYYSKSEASGPDGASTNNAMYGASTFVPGLGPARADQAIQMSGNTGTESFGFFTHSTYHFNDEWHLSGGLRYNDDRKYLQQDLTVDGDIYHPGFGGGPITFPLSFATSAFPSDNDSYYNLSGSLKLSYTPNDDMMYYVALDSAYRSGGFNLSALAPVEDIQTFEQEDSYAFEVGMKGTFLDNRLQLNIAYYYQQFKNYQFGDTPRQDNNTTRNFDDAGTLNALTLSQSHVLNADEALSRGVEMDFLWLITENFDLSGGLTYIDTEYKEFTGFCDDGDGDGSTINLYCDLSGQGIGSNFGIAPASWVANIQPAYHQEFEDWGVEWQARTQINYDDVKHINADVHTSLTALDGSWSVRMFVKNVLNRKPGEVLELLSGNSTDTYRYDLVAPRQVGVSFGYNF
jgi:iron complex outermembrane recepter protein